MFKISQAKSDTVCTFWRHLHHSRVGKCAVSDGGTSGITPKCWPHVSQQHILSYSILSIIFFWFSCFFIVALWSSCFFSDWKYQLPCQHCSIVCVSQGKLCHPALSSGPSTFSCCSGYLGIPNWHSDLLQVGCECHARLTTRTWGKGDATVWLIRFG